MRKLDPIKPMLLVGPGISPTEVGEVWHLMDTRLGLAPVMIDTHRFSNIELADYSHLLMVNGRYSSLDDAAVERIGKWVRKGGILVASKRAASWVTSKNLHQAEDDDKDKDKGKDEDEDKDQQTLPPAAYGEHSSNFSKSLIGGAIVNATIDTSHPLAYGYRRNQLALFRNGTTFLSPADNPYETYLRYTDKPLLSGYMGDARQQQLAGSAAGSATKLGRGAVIRLADNPNFRGFWYGTNRLYFNALYMAQILESTPVADTETLQ